MNPTTRSIWHFVLWAGIAYSAHCVFLPATGLMLAALTGLAFILHHVGVLAEVAEDFWSTVLVGLSLSILFTTLTFADEPWTYKTWQHWTTAVVGVLAIFTGVGWLLLATGWLLDWSGFRKEVDS